MELILTALPTSSHIGTEDTPVWMIFRNLETGKYEPVLVAWYNYDNYEEKRFLTLRTFGTKRDAEIFLKDFWESYWRLSL